MDEIARSLDKIDKSLESIHTRLNSIDVKLAKQQCHLESQVERCKLIEDDVEQIKHSIRPLQVHVSRVEGGVKVLGILSVLLGIVASLFGFFKG